MRKSGDENRWPKENAARKSRIRLFSEVFHINVDISKGMIRAGVKGRMEPDAGALPVWNNQEMGNEGEWSWYGDGEQKESERKRES